MANNPFFFTSLVANSEIMFSIFVQTFCLSSSPLAMALATLLQISNQATRQNT